MADLKRGLLVGPDLGQYVRQILDLAEIDKTMKEPLRKRLKEWQKTVLADMKRAAPDDPATPGSRIEKALRAKAPVISRRRKAIYASFATDGAYLRRAAGTKSSKEEKGIAWALAQHEDLTLRHTRGESKFMERPFFRHGPKVEGVVEGAFGEVKASIEGR
jgi:hypothetical protein